MEAANLPFAYEALQGSLIPAPIVSGRPIIPKEISHAVALCERYPFAPLAMITGAASRAIVLSIAAADEPAWQELARVHPPIDTPHARVGSGDLHYYFRIDESAPQVRGRERRQLTSTLTVELVGEGSYVAYPSELDPKTGRRGAWIKHPKRTRMKVLPAWLADLTAPRQQTPLIVRNTEKPRTEPPHERQPIARQPTRMGTPVVAAEILVERAVNKNGIPEQRARELLTKYPNGKGCSKPRRAVDPEAAWLNWVYGRCYQEAHRARVRVLVRQSARRRRKLPPEIVERPGHLNRRHLPELDGPLPPEARA